MRVAAYLAAFALVPTSLTSTERSRDVAAELERLIESTNALEGFRARYRMTATAAETDETREIELTLAYEAPDKALLDFVAAGQRQGVWISAGVIHMRTWDNEEMTSFADVELLKSPAVRKFEELLYSELPDFAPDAAPLEPGPAFRLWWRFDEAEREGDLKFEVSYADPRRQVLSWLDYLAGADADKEIDGEVLRTSVEGRLAVSVSLETGFITHIFVEREEADLTIELIELDTDFRFDELDVPRTEEDAEDTSAALRRLQPSLGNLRVSILRRIERSALDEELDWDESRTAFETVMRDLHARVLGPGLAHTRSGFERKVAEVQLRIEHDLESTADLAALRAKAAEYRRQFSAALDDLLRQSLAQVEGSFPLAGDNRVAAAMLETELEIANAIIAERLRSPVLASFDQVVDALLGE